MEPMVILFAFIAGFVFRKLGYPPLLGYLIAGFVAGGLEIGSGELIKPISELGVLLLLFTIGLKLNLKELIAPQVWAVAGLQMAVVVPLTAGFVLLSVYLIPQLQLDTTGAWTLAFALSFSSTVFAVKIFDERGESASLHAAIAIGILIVQDLIAVVYLVLSSNVPPSIFAIGLLALPLLRPLLLKMLKLVGHGELLILFGFCVALCGAELFELLHLKDGLGALVFGILLGNSSKSNELYKGLINFKDIFLIGFFLEVGYSGLPSWEMLLVAIVLGGLIFVRPVIYFFLLVLFKLRARTALLTGVGLFNYSEFGLIVAALAVSNGVISSEWVATMALAMSLSFFIATPFNTNIHSLYSRLCTLIIRFERKTRLPEEAPVELGNAQIVVLGMGRVGLGAYNYLHDLYPGQVVGIEENAEKVFSHISKGTVCIKGVASDRDFWLQAGLSSRTLILVSLTNHLENIEVIKLLKSLGYAGTIAVVSRFPDEKQALLDMGCVTFDLYAEAGHGFAEHVMSEMGRED